MKTKTIIVSIVIALLTSTSIDASAGINRSSFNDRTEQWLKPATGELRGSRGLDEVPTSADDPAFAPVQDAIPFILVLSGLYFASCTLLNRRKN
ncbi:hypothetical protein FACS1894176_02070 [Bacteroidia bacterium]|nr:hypothetical protein FACS1894176_02070 [Bacteroidia bacterium]